MMRVGVESGMSNNVASMNTVIDQIDAHLVDPRETVFFDPFNNITAGDLADQLILRAEAFGAIETSVQEGFKKIKNFLETEYLPFLRPEIGVTSLPDIGPEFYDQCLKFHTSTNMTVTQIHQLGLDEVDRIESEMRLIVEELGYDNLTLQQFSEMIRNDPSNYHDTPEALLEGFRDILENRVNPRLLELFLDIPEAELIIEVEKS